MFHSRAMPLRQWRAYGRMNQRRFGGHRRKKRTLNFTRTLRRVAAATFIQLSYGRAHLGYRIRQSGLTGELVDILC
jgi:hypothetical protein